MVEKLQQALQNGFQPALGHTLGFRVTAVGKGEATVEMDTNSAHHNPMGSLHGGVLCSIADTAMGFAHSSTLDDGETSTTLELHINFLRPVWDAKLRAVGRVIKAGRTISLIECDVFDEKARLVARASSTCMTLRGEQAEGRQLLR